MSTGTASPDGRRVDEIARGPEFIGIPEWCRRVGCSRESGYRAARREEIPGLFRIGRLKRVNWSVFVEATGPVNVTNG
jgi:predicted DNA-binding transcriptional regulator AlpA